MRGRIVIGAMIGVLIVAAGFGGWLVRGGGGGDAEAATARPPAIRVGVPAIVTPAQLSAFSVAHHPIYWAGPRPDTKLELTLTSKAAIFVRYLPESAKVGDPAKYLTVATYDDLDGYTALTAAKKSVASVVQAQNGAVIAVFKDRPDSTYFSFKDAGFQVEVFSPQQGQSRQLTDDGSITLVGGRG